MLWCILVIVCFVINNGFVNGAAEMEMTPSNPHCYQGSSLNITCKVVTGTITTNLNFNRPSDSYGVIQCADDFVIGNCIDSPGYKVVASDASLKTLTMNIQACDFSKDNGRWICGDADANTIVGSTTNSISPILTIINNTLDLLQNQTVTSDLNVSVTGNCTYQIPTCTWKYTVIGELGKNVSDELTTNTNSADSCNSGDTKPTCTLQVLKAVSVFAGKSLTLAVTISHASLPDPIELNSSAVLTFPVGIGIWDLVWAIILSVLMGLGIAVTVACVILFVIYFKEFRYWWFVLGVEGGILLVLAFTTIGLLASETKNDSSEYVVAAVLCTLSLIVGIGVIILVVIKTITMCQNTLEPKKHEAREDPDGKTDPAHTTDGSTLLLTSTPGRSARSLPPITGNTSSTSPTGQPSRPLPPSTGNTSPTTMSASEVVPNVNSGPESGPLPPINADTEKPKKKKKKKKHLREGDNADDTQKMDLENESPVHSIQE